MEADVLPRINRVIVTGFLQQEPELRHTPSGVAVASFRVRSGHFTRDRRGGLRETVSYFTVVVWQELAQRICRDARNGQGIYVEGALHSRSFLTAAGERKTVVEIYADSVETVPVFLGEREMKATGATATPHETGERPSDEPAEHLAGERPGESNEDIPHE
jgi:single-strand DNA-binding protein